jgi:hypothetical protein
LSLLGMLNVDCWLMYEGWHGIKDNEEVQKEFYSHLETEMIDNDLDNPIRVSRRQQAASQRRDDDIPTTPAVDNSGRPRCGVGPHLTPTKKRLRRNDGTRRVRRYQARCRAPGCTHKSTYVCSECHDFRDDIGEGGKVYLCHSLNGRNCFALHMETHHMG